MTNNKMTTVKDPSGGYDASSIQILDDISSVQTRPGMYVGDVHSPEATHHLVWEIVDNAIDEIMAGYATMVRVRLNADGSVLVEDDGRGVPVDIHEKTGRPAAEAIFSTLHAGGKFGGDAYKTGSSGLHGVGSTAVNALSDFFEVTARRDGFIHYLRFDLGRLTAPLKKKGKLAKGSPTGTTITFKPSAKFLSYPNVDTEVISTRLRRAAWLNKGVVITLETEKNGEIITDRLVSQDGLGDMVRHSATDLTPLCQVFRAEGSYKTEDDDIRVEAALMWVDEDRGEELHAFANTVPQKDGGTHADGLRAAAVKSMVAFAEEQGLFKRGVKPKPSDLVEGMIGAIHVRLRGIAFSSQTKERLITPSARAAVENVIGEKLLTWLESDPETAKRLIARATLAAEAREAARIAREQKRLKQSSRRVSSVSLPEKLADCATRDRMRRELFIVEGDSAGGSAKQARDREFQAILPLRGKILNAERAKPQQLMKNTEVVGLAQTIGGGLGQAFDSGAARYGRVIIMTDADIDGAHISTLLLTLFWRHMRPMVEEGRLYMAAPPLYRLRRGKDDAYLADDADLAARLALDGLSAFKPGADDPVKVPRRGSKAFDQAAAMTARIHAGRERIIQNFARVELADAVLGSSHAQMLLEGSGKPGARLKVMKAIASQLSESALGIPGAAGGWVIEPMENPTGWYVSFSIDGVAEDHLVDIGMTSNRDRNDALGIKAIFMGAGGREAEETFRPIAFAQKLVTLGERGALVSRYKGLGEMNPEELWETTMDPHKRRLIRVGVADGEAADAAFADIMAESGAGRRGFVESLRAGGGLAAEAAAAENLETESAKTENPMDYLAQDPQEKKSQKSADARKKKS